VQQGPKHAPGPGKHCVSTSKPNPASITSAALQSAASSVRASGCQAPTRTRTTLNLNAHRRRQRGLMNPDSCLELGRFQSLTALAKCAPYSASQPSLNYIRRSAVCRLVSSGQRVSGTDAMRCARRRRQRWLMSVTWAASLHSRSLLARVLSTFAGQSATGFRRVQLVHPATAIRACLRACFKFISFRACV